ncbi:MAG: 2-oxo acid dehydrogenase subunit E2 [Nevskiaceae bacterium]|nr:MAG: 2-oxo acid dehydrogenase subunit E2 [Nevskiaceae bacterium]TBR71406.1 MAG: 2-oxo acid dehydrogenase subunit E2 [Nevskiaceae bacterium]
MAKSMRYEFKLPDIGEGLTEGVISEWLVKVGDVIDEDAPLCTIETDKVAVEITAPCTGRVLELTGEPGETLEVGTVIATFETDEVHAAAGPHRAVETDKADSAPAPTISIDESVNAKPEGSAAVPAADVRAAPATRRLAREKGVDLNQLAGSGPRGRILQQDILLATAHGTARPGGAHDGGVGAGQAHTPTPISPEPGQTRVALTTLQKAVAAQMARSVTLIPHASSSYRCEAGRFVTLRKLLQERLGARVSFTAMVMKAMVPALQKFPNFNCSFDDATNEIVYPPAINIGFAAHTDDGLVVPVVRDCQHKNLAEISAEVDRLADAARNRKIKVADLRGGTITLSNVGSHGRVETTGGRLIINHPQAAIIGLSRIRPQAVVHDGAVIAAPCLDIYMSYDHRIIDGIYANLFIEVLAGVIEEPGLLLAN